jgi:hypothetical protein
MGKSASKLRSMAFKVRSVDPSMCNRGGPPSSVCSSADAPKAVNSADTKSGGGTGRKP